LAKEKSPNRRRGYYELTADHVRELEKMSPGLGEALNSRLKGIAEHLEATSGLRGPINFARQSTRDERGVEHLGVRMEGGRIGNAGDPIDPQDYVTKAYLERFFTCSRFEDLFDDCIEDDDDIDNDEDCRAVTSSFTPGAAVSSTTLPGTKGPNDIAWLGNYIYILSRGESDIYAYDISNPTAPVLKSTVATAADTEAIFVANGHLFSVIDNNLGSTQGGQVWSLSSPGIPAFLTTHSISTQNIPDIAVSGNNAYVTDRSGKKLKVWNVATPAAPTLVTTLTLAQQPNFLTISGTNIYVTEESGTFEIVDVSNPAAPSITSTTVAGSSALRAIFYLSPYLFFLSGNFLYIYDVSTPASPIFKSKTNIVSGSTIAGATVDALWVAGGIAYCGRTIALTYVDLCDITNPRVIGDSSVPSPGGSTGMYLRGSYAYYLAYNNDSPTDSLLVFAAAYSVSTAGGSSVGGDSTVAGDGTFGGILRLLELPENGENFIGFRAPFELADDVTFVVPATDGSVGDVLTTDGEGNLSFEPPAGSYTDEEAQDAVGGILVDSSTIDFTYTDATPEITAIVKDNSITEAKQVLADNTTNNVSSTKHGYAPKSPADATKFLNGAATPDYALVKDSDLSTSDITTNNVTTSKHGFTPKLPNDATKYLDGTGNYTVPGGTGSGAGDGGANPDIPPASPNTEDDEFTGGSLNAKWSVINNTVASVDFSSRNTSWLTVKMTGNQLYEIQQSYSNSGDFQFTACFSSSFADNGQGPRMVFRNSAETDAVLASILRSGGNVQALLQTQTGGASRNTGFATTLATSISAGGIWVGKIYMHVQRVSGSWEFWWSTDGITFSRHSTSGKVLTLHHINIELNAGGSTAHEYQAINWFRRGWKTM
jgi:hypothetical protein